MGDVIFVDVREEDEFAADYMQGALNLPLSKMIDDQSSLKKLPKDKKIVLYCNSGNRSGTAVGILQEAGFRDVENGINISEAQKKYGRKA